MSGTTVHRWPHGALVGDMVRGIVAVLGTLAVMLVVPVGSFAFLGLSALAILFALYLGGTVARWTGVVEVNDDGLSMTGGVVGRRTIRWAELKRFELRHFSMSRTSAKGWMDLKLTTGTASVTLDDKLDRFHEVLARAYDAARKAEIGFSDVTQANLVAAGIVGKPA